MATGAQSPHNPAFCLRGQRIFIAGHAGMVGSAVRRRLAREPCDVLIAPRAQLDLTRQDAVEAYLDRERPDAIIVAAAIVGGIDANRRLPVPFLLDNLMIAANLIAAAHRAGVDRLLFLGSSCIYPRDAAQPTPEDALLSGPLEPTNQWYALAKIAGVKLTEAYCQQHGRSYISAMPPNLYGPGDNFDPASSHVLPALIRKAHDAKREGAASITLWGTGAPRREFMHVDDCADAIVFLLRHYTGQTTVNIGPGAALSILDLATLVCRITGFTGTIAHDLAMPDGAPAKLMDPSLLQAMGWSPRIALADGIAETYRWYRETLAGA